MKESMKAKMALAAELLHADGSVTPAADLPAGLLVPESASGFAPDVQDALTAETVAQLETGSVNPTVGTLAEHAGALGYDVTVTLTPRRAGKTIQVDLPQPAQAQ
ncbi:hypothetical protein ACMT4L_09090 [Deinococcus sp. A31D244]|uniref:hypothetical protein n=1 Tax=Deinococcus sp. A31D244 TaxID=3397675 RepID=UPI0039DF809E